MTSSVFRHKHLHLVNIFLDYNKDGILSWADFQHIAEKFTLVHSRGVMDKALLDEWTRIAMCWWDGIRAASDTNNDNEITFEEWVSFFETIRKAAKCFDDLPESIKDCVQLLFVGQDYMRDGWFCLEDYKSFMNNFSCDMSRAEECFETLLNEEDKKNGNKLSPKRYDELLFKFYTTDDLNCGANHILGPYNSLSYEQLAAEHVSRLKLQALKI